MGVLSRKYPRSTLEPDNIPECHHKPVTFARQCYRTSSGSRPTFEVLSDIARSIIKRNGNLDLFYMVAKFGSHSDLKLPSWVPDWSFKATDSNASKNLLECYSITFLLF